MQSINIKKYTKDQMAKMMEDAVEKQEAAEAEAAAHFKDGVKLAEENEKLRGEIGTLTEKLEANEKALDEMTALYKSADHAVKNMRGKIEYLDKALSEATEKREAAEKEVDALCSEIERVNEARKKAAIEGHELAKQLGERMVELKAAEENARKAAVETNSIRAQLSKAETNAKRKEELLCAALHTIKTEKSIKEDYHKSLKWCMAHPWRNLWRCMKEHFRF